MGMHNPPHPGEILLEDVIPALGITITEMARRLGFARETFQGSCMATPRSARILPFGWSARA